MVRAGVVNHPERWNESGFCEIQEVPKRYAIIDLRALSELCDFAGLRDFQRVHCQWVEQGRENGLAVRDDRWSEAIAIDCYLLRTSRISLVSKPRILM